MRRRKYRPLNNKSIFFYIKLNRSNIFHDNMFHIQFLQAKNHGCMHVTHQSWISIGKFSKIWIINLFVQLKLRQEMYTKNIKENSSSPNLCIYFEKSSIQWIVIFNTSNILIEIRVFNKNNYEIFLLLNCYIQKWWIITSLCKN